MKFTMEHSLKELQFLDILIKKSQRQPKNLKRMLPSSTFGDNTTQGVTNAIINDAKDMKGNPIPLKTRKPHSR